MVGLVPAASPLASAGPRSRIVAILLEYSKTSIPIDFVANLVGLTSDQVEFYVAPLVEQGLIRQEGDLLSLTNEGRRPRS